MSVTLNPNNRRKCAKCGKTRAQDMTVSYHRFPDPGMSNFNKAHAWAKYCWPDKDWTLQSLKLLHTTCKVLCGRHFHTSKFYDSARQKLSKFSVPDADNDDTCKENMSHQLPNVAPSQVNSQQTFRVPFSEIENSNVLVQPSTSGGVTQASLLGVPSTSQHVVTQQFLNVEPSKVDPLLPFSEIENSNVVVRSSTSGGVTHTSLLGVTSMSRVDTEQSTLKDIESRASKELKPSQLPAKRSGGILRAINVHKVSQMSPRELKLYKICRNKFREIIRLRNKVKNLKTNNAIKKIVEDENVTKLCNLKISNSFMVLLQCQMQNCPRKPKGRRYTINQKIMSLVIYKKSAACYKLLRRMFTLPCPSSLNKLLNRVPLKPGINHHIFTALKNMSQQQTDDENLCVLSFDEMAIRKHLHYDQKADEIQGLQDHGNHGRKNLVANKALVFMLAGVRKKWKQPVAFYVSHTINADRMTVIVKEILTECFNSNMNVVGTICDLSTVNIKVLKSLGATIAEPYFSHCGREIVSILDPPHLLKCTRNLFMKYDVECTTDLQNKDVSVKGTAKWSIIEEFYKLDKDNPNFVYAPSLTNHHLYPNVKEQMRVYLAAQIFSHSVTAGILAKISSNELPAEAHATATFVKSFDELFDAVNADSPDRRRGKKFSTNMTSRSPHIELFSKMRQFISTMKYVGCKTRPPSQDGWIHTLNAIERLWRNLRALHINSLATRRLNQDPLENCFGCIRYSCGSNTNPTMEQFIAGIKTAIITNLRHSGYKKNCQDDMSILSNNLTSFLISDDTNIDDKMDIETSNPDDNSDEYLLLSDAVEAVEQSTPEGQACAYVCGFIFKKIRNNTCDGCRQAFLSETVESIHIFTSFKEYDASHTSLKYISKNVIQCVEFMANIINHHLKVDTAKIKIKQFLMAAMDCVDFSFLEKCEAHVEINKYHLKNSTFFICIKRFNVLKNREMDEEDRKKSLQRKMKILKNK